MTNNEVVLFLGVGVTLFLGVANLLYNLQHGKRSAFVNVVTSERIKWIARIREDVSNLSSLCDQWLWFQTQDNQSDLQRQIERLRNEIVIGLNPNDLEDQDLMRLLARLPGYTKPMDSNEYAVLKNALVSSTQALLKREWDKVKDETMRGDLRQKQ